MPRPGEIDEWIGVIRQRYENYLKTSFYFRDSELRASFQSALKKDELSKGPIHEKSRNFAKGLSAKDLAEACFSGKSHHLSPALIDKTLYAHQEQAIRAVHMEQQNTVVATGTASGKTECFLYPILFDLYQQHLDGKLDDPGVRALILYPMNALANDQRERLGEICKNLKENSGFSPTFGQYIGPTPESQSDRYRKGRIREEERLPGELIFRKEMRDTPPHILLTNYSMLEYLLIRPEDSDLFDAGRGQHWKFLVLDEAHQYRGAKGMEMGMLIRRLKQRLIDGGREGSFRCVATSATIASDEDEESKNAIAEFSSELFGEQFFSQGVIFGKYESPQTSKEEMSSRYHVFLRALEGAFLVHEDGKDTVVLNRKKISSKDGKESEPLEIALCRECGQHYYVGREEGGKLIEAIRDPSQPNFGVEYYLPLPDDKFDSRMLCRLCGGLSGEKPDCSCCAAIAVKKCESHKEHLDQLKKCEVCHYRWGDPVQEIVHGSDAPNAVIATALHELLPAKERKVLAFADSRQEAAFFAWYAEDSYAKVRDRNFILRSLRGADDLSTDDLKNRLTKEWECSGLFMATDTREGKNQKVLASIFREALADKRRLSLSGVGLIKWFVKIPDGISLPESMRNSLWGLSDRESYKLMDYLLDSMRLQRSMTLPDAAPPWDHVSPWPQQAYCQSMPEKRSNVKKWGGGESAIVKHFLCRMLANSGLSDAEKRRKAMNLMKEIWDAIREYDRSRRREEERILSRVTADGTFQLNYRWLRVRLAKPNELLECDTCANLTVHDIRNICPRNDCPGKLKPADVQRLKENHYRILYESANLPPIMHAEEHTAQIDSDMARDRQERFKDGHIHLLSSSTTFEVGVDLGDLEVVFLRNVPPESFNYTQRVGRAGRRETPGLAITYCRRNPHDLYHYENPERRIIKGKMSPPRLRMTNDKIILRHMTATTLSAFFKTDGNAERFKDVEKFVNNWESSSAALDLRKFSTNNRELKESLRRIVPSEMHDKTGLNDDAWIDIIAGLDSRLALSEREICDDYLRMRKLERGYSADREHRKADRIKQRMNTIAKEKILTFLSRKAIIPKYGFPVDVVELDTRPVRGKSFGVSLQRDLSQAIAEYAPGSRVIANKKEWISCGVKTIHGKRFPVKFYEYNEERKFTQWDENGGRGNFKYLSPIFGFVTPLLEKPKEPRRKAQRLYTTRPFFQGFKGTGEPAIKNPLGVQVTKAVPGTLVILCEGKNRSGFYICRTCGRHQTERCVSHKTPEQSECSGVMEKFSLGHELVTDVILLQFEGLSDQWNAYSLGFALLRGAAATLDVPDTDMNITIAGGGIEGETAIILYDNVPGGAGLVAQLEQESVFREMLTRAREHVRGNCGCDISCYGCLRSYRNQFAHPHLNRESAFNFLDAALRRSD